jgi:acid phosphatase
MKILCVPFFVLILVAKVNAQVRPTHTLILILENHSLSEIAGNPQAPYINSLWNDSHTAKLTQSYALTHPSQPNYIMFYSGSSQGITNNNLPTGLPFMSLNLGASLIQAGFSFIGYSEDLPSVGYTGESSGAYVRRHNPWVNWQGTGTNTIPSSANRPFSDFPTDFSQLPTVSIVVPNLNHDIHDGTVADCDTWVQNNLGNFIEWCKTNNGLFILTFDEDDFSANNQILTFFTGSNIKSGSYNQKITHYNVLRTIEDLYALPYAGASADSLPIQNIWLTSLPIRSLIFNASANRNTCILKWQTLEEQNTKEFRIERSGDNGQNWQTITTLAAAGNSDAIRNYSYTDNNPFNDINFYRIKQIDLDDHFIYSKILSVRFKFTNAFYRSYPNPVNNILYIATTKKEDDRVVISIIDPTGRLVLRKKSLIKIDNPAKIDLSHLTAGEYFVEINNGTEKKNETIILK